MARLVLISAPDRPAYEIEADPFSIGRLPDNHLPLADALASRRHAELRVKDGRLRIADLKSLNGVYVNNLKVEDEVLAHGDVITIGESKLLFEDEPGVKSGAPSNPGPGGNPSGPSVPPPAVKIAAPGLACPEIIKPLSGVEPGYEMEALSLSEVIKPAGEVSAPSRDDSLRGRYFFILYQVARALNSTNSLSELLDQTLALLFQVINAERGVIFLYGEDGELTPVISRSRTGGELPELNVSRTITRRAIAEKAGIITADARYDSRFEAASSIANYNIRSAIAAPLWERSRIRGAIYLDNLVETYAFSEDDLELLTAISNQVALAVQREEMQQRMRENAVVRANLERFHSPEVANLILQQSRLEDGFQQFIEEREVTVLFADICDFTPLLSRLPPHEAASLLNDYFEAMSEIIFQFKGTVDKFIGDAIMAIFGAPISHGNDAELSIFTAIELMKKMQEFRKSLADNKRFEIRIGINTGIVVTGYLGSRHRVEYSVLGDAVNVAARLQDLARPGTILVGEETYMRVSSMFRFQDRGASRLKGKKTETKLYEVVF